jgi:CheY-like chemotaxis protein
MMEYVIPMRILLVEDEADVRQFFARALRHVAPKVEVVQAVDGRDALEQFEREAFALILSDHRMPRMTGIELLRAVRTVSDIPFLIVTADRSIEGDAWAAGVTELLSKPISIVALRDAVARYLVG